MLKKLFNPFVYIAGSRSLLWGIKIMLITSILAYLFNIHFPDVISVKTTTNNSFWYYLVQIFSNWIIISLILYLLGISFSKSKIRIIDIFGTQALARFPYLLAPLTGIPKSPTLYSQHILHEYLGMGEAVDVSTSDIFITIIVILATLLLTIWMIALMYNAFKVSSNIKKTKSVLLFIIGLIISIVLSNIITSQLIKIFN